MPDKKIIEAFGVPWLQNFHLKVFLIALIIVLFIEMTDFFNGNFDVSLMYIVMLVTTLIIIPFIMVRIIGKILSAHVDTDENNLTNEGFTYFFISTVLGVIIIILSVFAARWFPIITYFEFSSNTAINLGIAVFIVLVIVTIVMKYWPLTILITIIGGQHLIYIISDDASQISYYTIVMGTLLVLFIIGVIVMSVLITRDKEE